MDVRIKTDHWYPKLIGALAVTIYPYIFCQHKHPGDTLLKHELHHIAQVKQTGWLAFYLSYLLFYIAGLIRYRSHIEAYTLNPYEVEAYDIESTDLTDAEREILDRAGIR